MILLTSASDLIQVITGGTQAIKVHASYVDISGTTVTPGRTNTAISSATTTSVVASPASSTQRNAKFISIYNADASASDLVTVQHTDGTTVVVLIKLTLLAGYTLTYNDLSGWELLDAAGGVVNTPFAGRFIGRTVLTSSTGTFTTSAATNDIFIRGVAGGGAGGGVTAVSSGAAGGGGAGSYLEATIAVSPSTGYSYTCGAGGTGASGAAGGNGTAATFIVGATTYTCNPGTGGPVATGSASLTANPGGAGGTVSTNGSLNATGDPGEPGVVLIVGTATACASGAGASSVFGGGGLGLNAAGNGNAAGGFGSGGSGGLTVSAAARTGGNGSASCWVVDEYA